MVGLPWRIAHQMLDAATGVHARQAASGNHTLTMIAATVDSAATLVDLLHTHDHVAPLCAELCTLVNELLREIVRMDTAGGQGQRCHGEQGQRDQDCGAGRESLMILHHVILHFTWCRGGPH